MTNKEIAARLGCSTVHLWKQGFRRKPLPTPDEIDWDLAQSLLDEGKEFSEVAARFGVSTKTLRRRRATAGLPPLTVSPRFGPRAPAWNGGRHQISRGYVYLHRPDHPHANARGYVREHRLVMEQHLGRYLDPQEVVHHINGVRDDNRLENLELFPNNAAHISATLNGGRSTA